jgi:peptidase E
MASGRKQIVAMGGGSFSAEPEGSRLDAYVLALSGQPRPKICFLPTASGDAAVYITKFYEAFGERAQATHLGLFGRPRPDMEAVLTGQALSMSAAATPPTCSRCGASTASTGSCARRGSAA